VISAHRNLLIIFRLNAPPLLLMSFALKLDIDLGEEVLGMGLHFEVVQAIARFFDALVRYVGLERHVFVDYLGSYDVFLAQLIVDVGGHLRDFALRSDLTKVCTTLQVWLAGDSVQDAGFLLRLV